MRDLKNGIPVRIVPKIPVISPLGAGDLQVFPARHWEHFRTILSVLKADCCCAGSKSVHFGTPSAATQNAARKSRMHRRVVDQIHYWNPAPFFDRNPSFHDVISRQILHLESLIPLLSFIIVYIDFKSTVHIFNPTPRYSLPFQRYSLPFRFCCLLLGGKPFDSGKTFCEGPRGQIHFQK